MVTYNRGQLVNRLHHSPLPVFSLTALNTLFGTRSRASLNAIISDLVTHQVLTQITPGKYCLTDKKPDQLVIANYLVTPSYISFESALNFHSILPQFPLMITSATVKKPQNKEVWSLTYRYSHLQPHLLFGFTLQNGSLISTPEKALLDLIYLSTNHYQLLDWDEYSLDLLDRQRLSQYLTLFKPVRSFPSITKQLKEHGLC